MKSLLCVAILSMSAIGCTTASFKPNYRTVIDSGYEPGQRPRWISNPNTTWTENGNLKWKATTTVRGDQRVDGCFTLAKLELRENLLTEIQSTLKSEINSMSDGIGESDAQAINRMVQQTVAGQVKGARVLETTFERYVVGDIERVDCFVLGQLPEKDLAKLRQEIASGIKAINPEVAEAMKQRQLLFLNGQKNTSIPAPSDKLNEETDI